MANILTLTSGLRSIVYPSLELCRRLAAAGHQVTFAGDTEFRQLAEHHGLGFLALEASGYPEFVEQDARQSALQRLATWRQRRQQAVASTAMTTFVEDVRKLNPDLILIDGEMHEHIIAGAAAEAPMALLNSFASIWRRPGLPPAHCQVRPGVGWWGSRVGIWLLWQALSWRKRVRAARQWRQRLGCDRRSVLRRLARDAGFDWRGQVDAGQWLMPFTYRHLPVLSLHALEFEFPHHPAEHVHYVGPMLLESRVDRPLAEARQGELEAIFERRRSEPDSQLIYAAFGSVLSTDVGFLKQLLEVTRERPRWQLVVSLSDRISAADLGPLPERVHLFPWVPQRLVLEHADAAITHGGINTIDECVASAVPMLIYCGSETDMAGNTARVEHLGIGLAGDRERDNAEAVRQHLDRLLAEPRFAAHLSHLQRQYAAYAENRVAEQLVAGWLE